MTSELSIVALTAINTVHNFSSCRLWQTRHAPAVRGQYLKLPDSVRDVCFFVKPGPIDRNGTQVQLSAQLMKSSLITEWYAFHDVLDVVVKRLRSVVAETDNNARELH